MINRRTFLRKSAEFAYAASIASSAISCEPQNKIKGTLSGPDYALGHRLRQGGFPAPKENFKTDVVVVGGGISGLAAARQLSLSGVSYRLLEMETNVGGNSLSGNNPVSAFPLGAHYLPVPGLHDADLLLFLKECGAITGYENGKPVYNEYYLCFDPKERLYINNHWQNGLVPRDGLSQADSSEFSKFHDLVEYYRLLRGADGKEGFTIPLSMCSDDPEIRKLDKVTFADFLEGHQLRSPYLLWYANYCCADDFGGNVSNISAWAGIHYFTSRKGVAANADPDDILTWPQGNGWLVSHLKKFSETSSLSHCMVYSIDADSQKATVDYIDATSGTTKRIITDKVIVATPQFINQKILAPKLNRTVDYGRFVYAPWMVANLTYSGSLDQKRGETLSWDNVIFGSSSLGYVNANHQDLNFNMGKRVLTYYLSLTGNNHRAERMTAQRRNFGQWYDLIISDLKKPHPEIEKGIESAEIWTWGHGMIRPSVGFMTEITKTASAPLGKRIFFAHTDLGGISIFEEAFQRGTQAAKQVLT